MIAAARQGGLVGRGPRDPRDHADRLSALRRTDRLVGFEQAGRRFGTSWMDNSGWRRDERKQDGSWRAWEGKRRLINKT